MTRRKTMARKTRKTKAASRSARRVPRTARKTASPPKAADRLRETWAQTVASLAAAEAAVEKRVRALLERNRISTRDASTLLKDVNALVGRERKKAARQLEARLQALQARARKERKVVARMANDAAQNALAAFNIPSRQEVQELTRKVDQLSRKIDSFRR
jgi:polyhydroxyalkanoate synthesis regulator phasin